MSHDFTIAGALLRGMSVTARALPLPAALGFGRGIGWLLGRAIGFRRREILDRLGRCFPEKSVEERRAILNRTYAHLGMNLIEVLRLQTATVEEVMRNVELVGHEHFEAAWSRGKGVLVLSGHVGNWEYVLAAGTCAGYKPAGVIVKPIRDRGVNKVVTGTRARFGVQAFAPHNSYRACLASLKRNEILGFVIDQNMTYGEGIFVDFFGDAANTTPGLAIMSAQSGAPVVPIFARRLPGGRHRITAQAPIDPPPDRKPETVRDYTQRYSKITEDAIRECPEQWLWLHRRWKTRPREDTEETAASRLRNPKLRA
jgi:KDO2-lipid IV(A) lauroyltransferase